MIVLLVPVRHDIKLDVREDGKLLPLILLSYGFDFPLKLKFPLFDREWLKIILADRGLLYLMWSCNWAESKGFDGSTIVLTMLVLVYVWSIGRVFISRDVWWIQVLFSAGIPCLKRKSTMNFCGRCVLWVNDSSNISQVFIFYLIWIRVACPVLYDVKLDIVLYDVKLDSVKIPDRDDALVFLVWMQQIVALKSWTHYKCLAFIFLMNRWNWFVGKDRLGSTIYLYFHCEDLCFLKFALLWFLGFVDGTWR